MFSPSQDNPRRGALLIVVAVSLQALADALVKSFSEGLSLWQLLTLAPVLSLVTLVALLRHRGIDRPAPQTLGWIGLRSLLLLTMWIAFYAALPWITLGVAAAGIYTTPLFIVILAMGLGERLHARRVVGLMAGFVGILVVLRPGSAAFDVIMALPVAAALCYAAAMVLTRRRLRDVSPLILAMGLNVAFLLAGLVGSLTVVLVEPTRTGADFLLSGWQRLDATELSLMALYAALMLVVNVAVAEAYQLAPSSLVAALDYLYLVFALGWGWLFFGEVPDVWAILGMVVIVFSGWLTLTR
ncbi:DMT family transporter [Salinicola halophilus]|uniref:DMT family transporter n=1 Tax=Salinicola halophilus TaxID=184065 RepID=UPI0013A67DEE|nr:DMT family transporter [Salinicola halophilus]